MADLNTGAAKVYVKSNASTREKGWAVSPTPKGGWWIDLARERTPELRWPMSVQVYQDMVRQDSQVSMSLNAVSRLIIRALAGAKIDGKGCDPQVTNLVAHDLGLPIVGADPDAAPVRTRDRFSWLGHNQTAVKTRLQYGHSIFEQVYAKDPTGVDALWHLRRLGYRPSFTIAAWGIEANGDLDKVIQWAPAYAGTEISSYGGRFIGAMGGPELPADSLVIYVNEFEGGNWLGTSALRPAYKPWLLKDRFLRLAATVLDRNALGLPVGTAADDDQGHIDDMYDIVTALRGGDEAGAALPNGAKLELLGVNGKVPDILPWVSYFDDSIARAFLANFLNLEGNTHGSRALSNDYVDFFTLAIQTHADDHLDTANKHIVEDLVDVNFGPDEPAPRIVIDDIGARNAEVLSILNSFVDSGLIRPDETLEKFIRTSLDLPMPGGLLFQPVPKTTNSINGTEPAESPDGPSPTPPTSGASS